MEELKATGRPTALTPELQDTILAVIRVGNFRDVAAQAAGISERTFVRWMAEGKLQTKGPKKEFRLAVLKAEADAEMTALKKVWDDPDPKHAEWYLERKHSDKWAGQRHEINTLKKIINDLAAKLEALVNANNSGPLPPLTPAPEEGRPDITIGRESDGEE